MDGRETVIVEAVRTPMARVRRDGGALRDVHANALLGVPLRAVFDRTGLDPALVDDVQVGCVQQYGEQSYNVGRNAWLQAGLPVSVPASTIDRQCGSSQQAVNTAASLIASGVADVVVAAGVEHMSRIPLGYGLALVEQVGTPWPPDLLAQHPLQLQGPAADQLAREWGLSRAALDEFGARSHALAAAALADGRFAQETVPVPTADGVVSTDDGVRPDTTAERLAALPPAFGEAGTVTAGTSSQITDGAAALLLAARDVATAHGLTPRARVVDHVCVGVDPVLMLTGPISATQCILARNGMSIDDIDLFEVNEAFAPVVLAWQHDTKADLDRINVNGGAIALGHPLGATGARLVTSVLHELERRDAGTALVTMCCGGGLGTATLIERV
jgi:acetyl-CoA acetyltransferase family protein